jgi:hypothetical protein
MTSVRPTTPDYVDGPCSAARGDSVRLSLKPSSSARGVLDGAWWPQSTDPALELVALSEEVGARCAPVRRIGLNMAGWDSAPRRIRLASDRKIAVDWFRISSVHRVRVHSTDNQRIDLLLIPVDTTPAIAELALTMATNGHDPELTTTGDHPSTLAGPPEEAQASWAIGLARSRTNSTHDDEGNPPDHPVHDRAAGTPPSDVSAANASLSCPTNPANRIDLPLNRKDNDMVMATGSRPGSSCLTTTLAPLVPGQPPATTRVSAPTNHTTASWNMNDPGDTNPWDDHPYHGGEPRMCPTTDEKQG